VRGRALNSDGFAGRGRNRRRRISSRVASDCPRLLETLLIERFDGSHPTRPNPIMFAGAIRSAPRGPGPTRHDARSLGEPGSSLSTIPSHWTDASHGRRRSKGFGRATVRSMTQHRRGAQALSRRIGPGGIKARSSLKHSSNRPRFLRHRPPSREEHTQRMPDPGPRPTSSTSPFKLQRQAAGHRAIGSLWCLRNKQRVDEVSGLG